MGRRLFVPLIFLAALFVMTGLYKPPTLRLESFLGNILFPVSEATHHVVSRLRRALSDYLFLVGIHQENHRLREEIERLHGEVNRLREGEARAQRLEKLLHFKKTASLSFVAADVIGRDAGPWFETLIINKGTADGVSAHQGVITPRGVVGKVIKAFLRHAQVLFMTDRSSAVAVLVQRTREEGIVQGAGRGQARLKYLPVDAQVAPGDFLVTSGLEGSFVKGIRVGQVQSVRQQEDLFLDVTVTPELSFSGLEEVLVLTSLEERRPSEISKPF